MPDGAPVSDITDWQRAGIYINTALSEVVIDANTVTGVESLEVQQIAIQAIGTRGGAITDNVISGLDGNVVDEAYQPPIGILVDNGVSSSLAPRITGNSITGEEGQSFVGIRLDGGRYSFEDDNEQQIPVDVSNNTVTNGLTGLLANNAVGLEATNNSFTGQPLFDLTQELITGALVLDQGETLNDQTLDGTTANDVLRAGQFNDILNGGAGDDLLEGRGGNDTIDGGDGTDLAGYGLMFGRPYRPDPDNGGQDPVPPDDGVDAVPVFITQFRQINDEGSWTVTQGQVEGSKYARAGSGLEVDTLTNIEGFVLGQQQFSFDIDFTAGDEAVPELTDDVVIGTLEIAGDLPFTPEVRFAINGEIVSTLRYDADTGEIVTQNGGLDYDQGEGSGQVAFDVILVPQDARDESFSLRREVSVQVDVGPVLVLDEAGQRIDSFTRIQDAVDAVVDLRRSGDEQPLTISIGAGTYAEQVILDGVGDLTLTGELVDPTPANPKGLAVTITGVADPNVLDGADGQSVAPVLYLQSCDCSAVTIQNLAIDAQSMTVPTGVQAVGIMLDGPSEVVVDNVSITGIGRTEQDGTVTGYGIFIDDRQAITLTDPVAQIDDGSVVPIDEGNGDLDGLLDRIVDITDVVISGTQRTGIFALSNSGSNGPDDLIDIDDLLDVLLEDRLSILIADSTIERLGGAPPLQTDYRPFGIDLIGVDAVIENNTITGIGAVVSNGDAESFLSGALIRVTDFAPSGVIIDGNRLTGLVDETGAPLPSNVIGIWLENGLAAEIIGNTFNAVNEALFSFGVGDLKFPVGEDETPNIIQTLVEVSAFPTYAVWADFSEVEGNEVFVGTDRADLLIGSQGDDVLAGDGGDDELQGNAGSDSLNGGDGTDPEQVLLERADESLGAAVAFRGPDEGW